MLKERLFAAAKTALSDLVIADIQIVDVFSQEIYTADVAVKDGFFVGMGDYKGHGKEQMDGKGKYIIPGFIDAHAHIESALVTPIEYSNVSLLHGITTVIADPHEIANVAGIAGIEFMIENARNVPMDIHFMLPSCVPATAFENSGALLEAHDLAPLYGRKSVLGLAEVMNFPALLNGDSDMLQKIQDAQNNGLIIDGHGAGFDPHQLNIYATAEIRTDHECDTWQGLVDRVQRGIYTLVREGTVCKDLLKLLPAINEKNSRFLCFSTDDKHLDDLLLDGGVDFNVRLAIENGLNPATAIQMATLNAAQCYQLRNKGAIAPGYIADFSIVEDLQTLDISRVYKNGLPVACNKEILNRVETSTLPSPKGIMTSINMPNVTEKDLVIDMGRSTTAHIIGITEGGVVSDHLKEEVDVEFGCFRINIEKDQLKIAVVERHKNLGNIAVGIVKGLRLKKGAIATTIAHDSHNLITAGTNEPDMMAAIEAVRRMQGGIVVVENSEIVSSLKLEIGGLMTAQPAERVVEKLSHLRRAMARMAPECPFNPFLSLSFMSLVVIPNLKISDRGLFDFASFDFIDVPVATN